MSTPVHLTPNEQGALMWLLRDEENDGDGFVAAGSRIRPYFDTLIEKGLVELQPGCKHSFNSTDAGREWNP